MIRTLPALLVLAALTFPLTREGLAASGYNGSAAAAYADTYWSKYNSAYPSFANKGGDCTNFVSQALYAGGIQMRTAPAYGGDAAWYIQRNGKQWSWSAPWVNAQHTSVFLQQHLPGVTQIASEFGAAPGQTVANGDAQPGDVVLYDWNNDGVFDHEAIITGTDGARNVDGTIDYDLVDAHTNDRYHVYWTLAQYNATPATTRIVVLHVSPTAS